MKHSNKIFLALCGLLLLLWQPNESKAQTSYSYGTSASETFRVSAVNPTDDSFLAGGTEDASIDPGLLVNIDDTGTLNWAKKYSYTQGMSLADIHMKNNGNAVVLFYTLNTTADRRDALLMEVDGSGNVLWSKTYVNTTYEVRFRNVTALSSGDYILTGSTSTNNSTSTNAYHAIMMKVDATGNEVWLRRDAHTNSGTNMSLNGATEAADGNLLVAGHLAFNVNNNGNYHNGYVAKIDVSNGNTLWNKEYPNSIDVTFYQIEELANGDIVIAGNLQNTFSSGITTFRQLFVKVNSTGTVLAAKEYDFPGGNSARSFKIDNTTGNLFFVGYEAATTSTADRDNYWVELTDSGDFVDGYRYALPDYEGVPMIEINDLSINVLTTTKSFSADPSAAANDDFAMFLVDRNNPLADCNISQFIAESTNFTFSTLDSVVLTLDAEFTLTESTVTLSVDSTPFQQSDICFVENPLIVDGIATDGDCELQGIIDITVTGGDAPYVFNWSNGETTEDIVGLSSGAYSVTVSDIAGTTAIASFSVTSEDTTPPVALCQSINAVLDATGNVVIDPFVFMLDAGSSDNCGEVTFSVEPNSFTCEDVGTQTVFFTVTDMAGNTDVCETTIEVVDDTDPTVVCQDITVQLDSEGNVTVDPFMIAGGSTDACGIFSIDVFPNTFDCSNIGPNEVNVAVADTYGNTVFCTAIVTVESNNEMTADAVITNIPCNGEGGFIDLTVTGGIPGYIFQWSNGTEAEDLTGITTAGTYNVIITDACGTQIEQSFDITQEACCELFPEAFIEGCDGMNTVDIADDVLLLYVNATANNPGPSGMFHAFDLATSTLLGTFPYGIGTIVNVPYVSTLNIYFEDADDSGCDGSITLDSLETCSPLPEPIPCGETSVFYQVRNGTTFSQYDPATLNYIDVYTNPYDINAIGYNVEDGFVYGIKGHSTDLVRIGSDGIYVNLGSVNNLPYLGTGIYNLYYVGDFDLNGNLFVSGGGAGLYEIDVNVLPLTATPITITGGTVASSDFSFIPSAASGAAFYGLTEFETMYSITTTGVYTNHGSVSMPNCATPFGATYADNTGTFYAFCNTDGNLYEVDINAASLTGVLLDATGIGLSETDGASCANSTYVGYCIASLECSDDINATLDGTGCEVVVNYELDTMVCEGYTLTQTAGLASGANFPLGTTIVTYELTNADGTETITCSFNVNVSNVAPTAADYVLTGQAAAIIGEGDCYQLTTESPTYQSGSIYYQSRLNLDYNFQLDFEINLGSIDGNGADGMTFILQPISSSLGGNGGDLGFTGIGPSVGVEFDTWQNSWASDPQNDHISFQRNGNLRHTTAGYLDDAVTRETVPNMEVGAYRPVSMRWNATTKELTYIYNNRPARTVTQDITNTIFGGNPNVFWGWSAGTGIAVNDQSVCITGVSFVEGLTVDAAIIDVPCNGLGMIDLTVSGGIPAYTFLWSNGSTDEDLSPITEAGDYTVIITDACGHEVAQTYTVNQEECPCQIEGAIVYMDCSDMGTSNDPNDDVITLVVGAQNGSSTGMYDIYDAAGNLLGTKTYGDGLVTTVTYTPSVSFTFTDVNDPECTETVTVDLVACSVCAPSLVCPDDINATLDGTGCDVVVNYDIAVEFCEGYSLALIAGLESGSSFPLGTTVVTYELSNGSNTITCSFNVNVSNVAPTAADYVLTGNAAAIVGEGQCYQLTTTSPTYQSGSIYYQARLNLDYDFKLDFEINLGSIDASGADGMTFILQPISSSLGGNGGDLGFTGIGPSVGIEFDTWRNSWASDPQNDHISFQRNGNLRHTAGGYLDANVTRETVPNMEVGAYRPVSIQWNATTKELTYIYNNRPARTVTQDIANTIFGGNPNVFWGWSAGTGAAVNNQSVCITGVSFVEGMTVDATITDVPCEGAGMIDLTVSGGIPGYTFLWSDNSTNEDLSPITEAGDYSVTITDACGNTVVETYTVGQECCPSLICPDDINATLDGTGCEVVVNYAFDVDVCEGYTLTQTAGFPSGSTFPLGTTVVTYELTNADGTETITCSFNVNVSNVAPTAADYVLTGHAAAIVGEGQCYQLTTTTPTYQSGSIYYQARLNLDYDFKLDFEINLGNIDASGADGMTFILQPISSSLGGNGGDLGFTGIGPSVGVEFDTWRNSWASDPQNDHISFQRNGNLRHTAGGYLDATVGLETVPNMEVGAYRPVSIQWNATTKELTYIYNNRPARTVTQDIANTIFGGNPNVFWGWSAGTGAAVNNQSVCITGVSFVEGMTVDATITDVPCEGAGMIDLTVSGGIPGYTYLWSDGSMNEDLAPITMAGDYAVTITDACGNTVAETYTVGADTCVCEITPILVQEGCDNMGTSDISDDIITLYVDATAINGSGSFNVVDASTFTILGTFAYGGGGFITVPYTASISLIYEDAANPECSEPIAIDIIPCEYCTDVNITITVDNYPKETTWDLVDANGNVIQDSNGHLGQNPDGTVFSYDFCLPDGCYDFTIYDSYGDGICCDPYYGNGSYTVTDMTSGTVLNQGGQFGSSETTSFCFGDVAPPVPCTYEHFKNNAFEGGWGVWNDGGEDCARIISSGIGTIGNWSIRLRDNTATSVMTSNSLDLTAYTEATVLLVYKTISMDNSTEGFFLEISLDGGATFTVVEEWNEGDEFQNNINYTDAVVIPGPFTATTQFRFRCDASGDADYVYIDRIQITGCREDAANVAGASTPMTSRTIASTIQKPDLAIAKLYPNPANDYVNIDMKSRVEGQVSINIYTTTGQMVYSVEEYAYEGKNQFTVNLDKLPNGTYMVEINDGKKTDIQRLVIMK